VTLEKPRGLGASARVSVLPQANSLRMAHCPVSVWVDFNRKALWFTLNQSSEHPLRVRHETSIGLSLRTSFITTSGAMPVLLTDIAATHRVCLCGVTVAEKPGSLQTHRGTRTKCPAWRSLFGSAEYSSLCRSDIRPAGLEVLCVITHRHGARRSLQHFCRGLGRAPAGFQEIA
jgi:hypothetical protein